ncbi:unnamed protein product [Symbiodinium sp. CCMP2456]|nr:unnamed protein product [Symbiodinium sp. CCMP2456]
MQVSLLVWLLPSLGGCHWIQRQHLKQSNASSALSPLPEFDGLRETNISQSTWRCISAGQLFQVYSSSSPHLPIAEGGACFAGFTKFFWAAVLALFSLIGLCLFVPLMLEITRRRPPGQPLVLCGIIFDCCPPKNSAEQLVTSPASKSPFAR